LGEGGVVIESREQSRRRGPCRVGEESGEQQAGAVTPGTAEGHQERLATDGAHVGELCPSAGEPPRCGWPTLALADRVRERRLQREQRIDRLGGERLSTEGRGRGVGRVL